MFRVDLDLNDLPEDFQDPHEDMVPIGENEEEFDEEDGEKQNEEEIIDNSKLPEVKTTVVDSNEEIISNENSTQNGLDKNSSVEKRNNDQQISEHSSETNAQASPHDVFPTRNLTQKLPGSSQASNEQQSNSSQIASPKLKKKRDDAGLITIIRQVHDNQADFDKEINEIHQSVPDYVVKIMEENMQKLSKDDFSLDKNLIVNADSKQTLTYSQFLSHIRTFKQSKEPITRFLLHTTADDDGSMHHVVSQNTNLSSASSMGTIGSYENLLRLQKSDIPTSASMEQFQKQKVRRVIGLFLPTFINVSSLSLGLSACGFKVALLNPLYSVKRLTRIIQFSHVSTIFTTAELLPQVARVFKKSNGRKTTEVKKIILFDSQKSSIESLIRQAEAEKTHPTQKQLQQLQQALPTLNEVQEVPIDGDEDNAEADFNDDILNDDESMNRKQLMIIQNELEEMKPEHEKWGLPNETMLVPAISFFRFMCVNVQAPQEIIDIEIQKKKVNEIAFIFFSGGKFIGLTHKNLIASMIQQNYQFGKENVIQKDRIKSCLGLNPFSARSFCYLLETAIELSTFVLLDLVAFVDKRATQPPKKSKEIVSEPVENNNKQDLKILLKKIDLGKAFRSKISIFQFIFFFFSKISKK